MKTSPYVYPGLDPKLRPLIKKKTILTPTDILKIVADGSTNVTVNDLISRRRFTNFVDSRQLFCYIMRYRFGYSYAATGRFIERDHATAIHSCKVHENKFRFDKEYKELSLRVFKNLSEFLEKKVIT